MDYRKLAVNSALAAAWAAIAIITTAGEITDAVLTAAAVAALRAAIGYALSRLDKTLTVDA